jgi:beta-glucosidase
MKIAFRQFRTTVLAALLALGFIAKAGAQPATPAPKLTVTNPAEDPTKPSPGGVRWFHPSHGRNMAATANKKDIELCFFGDSITQGWDGDLFAKFYGKYNSVNFGVGGDKIQHQLWRIEQGELKGHNPKVIVLLIGINNLGFISPADTAIGITSMVRNLQGKFPSSKILLLGLLPAREAPLTPGAPPLTPEATIKGKTAAVNAIISKLDDKKKVRYFYFGNKFLDDKGEIRGNVLKDSVHPSRAGYMIWGEAMAPLLTEMMRS